MIKLSYRIPAGNNLVCEEEIDLALVKLHFEENGNNFSVSLESFLESIRDRIMSLEEKVKAAEIKAGVR